MKLIEGQLYLTWAESLISENTLFSARQRGGSTYVFDKCPVQGNLVAYQSLSDTQKLALVQSGLYGTDVEAWYYSKGFEVHLVRDEDARAFYRQYKYGSNATSLTTDNIDKYTRYAEVMNLLRLKRDMLTEALKYLNAQGITRSKNADWFKRVLWAYIKDGYAVLVSGKHGNECARKITDEVGDWLVAQYALPTKMTTVQLHLLYLAERKKHDNWEELSESGITTYLMRSDVIQSWYIGRHGLYEFELKFGIQNKLKRSSCAHRLWMSDGTGFNYESDRNMHRIYWVMDDYSECIIGWAWSRTENRQVAFQAYKNAVKNTGYRPQEIKYDNASTHKPLHGLFSRLASLVHKPSAPNRASGKTIESVTGRFQAQVMSKWWFFTGQNRGSRKLDSKQNDYFVDQYKSDIPKFEHILKVFENDVEVWNNNPHYKTGIPRIQMMNQSVNEAAMKVDTLDMIELFWLSAQRTYTARGVMVQIGAQKYEYEVMCDGQPDLAFRQRWIKEQFTVKYDPDDMSYVALYEQAPEGLKYVCMAHPMNETFYAAGDQDADEATKVKARQAVRKAYTEMAEREHQALEERTGISADNLVKEQNKAVRSLAQKWREDDDQPTRRQTVTLYNEDESDYSEM